MYVPVWGPEASAGCLHLLSTLLSERRSLGLSLNLEWDGVADQQTPGILISDYRDLNSGSPVCALSSPSLF